MSNLSPEAKIARAKYMREWRRRNPEKNRGYDVARWEREGDKIRQAREQTKAGRQSEAATPRKDHCGNEGTA